jgi:hypothetical protein
LSPPDREFTAAAIATLHPKTQQVHEKFARHSTIKQRRQLTTPKTKSAKTEEDEEEEAHELEREKVVPDHRSDLPTIVQ